MLAVASCRGWRAGPRIRAPLASFPQPSRGPAERPAPVYQLDGEKQCQACCKMLSAFPDAGWLIPTDSLLTFGRVVRFKSGLEGWAGQRKGQRPSGPDLHLQETGDWNEQAPFSWGGLWNLECSTWRRQRIAKVLNIRQNFCQDHVPPILYFSNCIFLWVNSLFSNIAFLALISMKTWFAVMFFLIQIKINTWGTSRQSSGVLLPVQRVWVRSLVGS